MKKQVITIGKRDFEIGKRPYVMGILNVTPDSFSDGGKYARAMISAIRSVLPYMVA